MTPLPVSARRGRLLQVLGLAFGLAVIIGNTIGVGILRTPGEIAARLPSEAWIAAVWLAGGAYALLLLTSRAPVAMSHDRLAPELFTSVNRGGTPAPALFGSAFVALLFLLSGTFDDALAVMAFFFVASYTLSFSSVFVSRWREPDTPRPFRAWGFPWTTGLALLGSIAFLATSVVGDWEDSWKSLALLVASYPVFLAVRRALRSER